MTDENLKSLRVAWDKHGVYPIDLDQVLDVVDAALIARAALSTATALVFKDVARLCRSMAGNATLDTTGVERSTLLMVSEKFQEMSNLPPHLVVLSSELILQIEAALKEHLACYDICGRKSELAPAALDAIHKVKL